MSLRDLAGPRQGDTAGELMTRPAAVVHEEAAIAGAGRLLAETGYHRLVVVDRDGRAVGLVSALDVVRGLLGVPAVHPASFPHLDPQTGLIWSDDQPLVADRLEAAPNGQGLIVLTHGGAGVPERVVWAESAQNIYARLTDISRRLRQTNRCWPSGSAAARCASGRPRCRRTTWGAGPSTSCAAATH